MCAKFRFSISSRCDDIVAEVKGGNFMPPPAAGGWRGGPAAAGLSLIDVDYMELDYSALKHLPSRPGLEYDPPPASTSIKPLLHLLGFPVPLRHRFRQSIKIRQMLGHSRPVQTKQVHTTTLGLLNAAAHRPRCRKHSP